MLALRAMDPAQALADLTEISSQVRGAVIVDGDGSVVASSFPTERGERVAGATLELLRAAEEMPRESGRAELTQLQAATPSGSVFVVRDDTRVIAAVTERDPTVGLVFYDLKTALRLAFEDEQRPSSGKSGSRSAKEKGADA